MKNLHSLGNGTDKRYHNQLMNWFARCPMSQNDRDMTIFTILTRFENFASHAPIEVLTRVVAFCTNKSVNAANSPVCTRLIFSLITGNVFPYFHRDSSSFHVKEGGRANPAAAPVFLSAEKILVVVRGKVVLRTRFTAERFTVADLLQIVQTAGNTLVSVGVESVEVDAGSSVNAAVHL